MPVMRKILFTVLIVASFFILLELFLRLCVGVPTHTLNYSLYDTVPGDYRPNQDFVDRARKNLPYHVHINSQGFRGKEVSIPKKEGVFRILCLGDSFTFGDGVDDEETYPSRLEARLNQPGGPLEYEVINAGCCGYTSSDELEYVKEKGLRLDPDVVVVAFSSNDVAEQTRQTTMRQSMKLIRRAEPWKSIIRSSALYNAFRKLHAYVALKARLGIAFDQDVNILRESDDKKPALDKLWAFYFADVKEMKDYLQQDGVELILLIFSTHDQLPPGAPEDPQRRLMDFAAQNGITVLNLLEPFRAAGPAESLYLLKYGDAHPSARGYDVAARALAGAIQKRISLDSHGRTSIK